MLCTTPIFRFLFVMLMFVTACMKADGPKTPVADCDISVGSCTRLAGELSVTFEIYPRPVFPMEDVAFGILLEKEGVPVEDAEVTADFTMPGMYMGTNIYALVHIGDGVYRAEGVLPRCPKGGKLWRADVTIHQGSSAPLSVSYLFEVD